MNDKPIIIDGEELTQENINQLVSGVRPEGMEFETFKRLRKSVKQGIKGYLEGRYFFISTNIQNIGNERNPQYVRKTATYRK